MVAETMPATSDAVPLLGKFFRFPLMQASAKQGALQKNQKKYLYGFILKLSKRT